MDDVPLPGMPEPPPPALARPAAARRITKYRGPHRVCDECVRIIHALGIERAPYPGAAKWRAVLEDFDGYLCYFHQQEFSDHA